MNVFFNSGLVVEILRGPVIVPRNEDCARIEMSLGFWDTSRLEVRLSVRLVDDITWWRSYSFHYMTRYGVCIFRYDNSRHYPELPYFPNHKHEGPDERVIACREPSIRAIRDEIESYLRAD